MKLEIVEATTSQTILVFIQDSSSTVGAGLTGLAFGSAGLSWYYYREEAGTGATQVTLATMTIGTWATGGFIELDATDMPGWYELGVPDAAIATGADFVGMQLKGASNMAQLNLEIQLISGDPYPIVNDPVFGNSALNDSISNIAPGVSGGGAVNASGATITTGTETLTYTATHAQDGTLHEVAAAAGNTDFEYTVTLGANQLVTDVFWRGYVQSNGDSVQLQFYNWVTTAFVTELVLSGSNGTTLFNETIAAISAYTGTGADVGKIRFRFLSTTTTNIATDRLRFEFTTNFQSAGYANGQIWVKTVGGTAGTTPFFNGVVERPVLTWADAVTLSPTIGNGLTDFHAINGSTILLTGVSDNFSIFGDNWTLQLGSRSVAGAYFQGAMVSGIGTSSTEVHYEGCDVATMSVQIGHFDFCSFGGTVTMTLAGDYNYHNCYSKVAGVGGPIFTKTAGQVITAQWRNWAGSLTLSGIQASDVMTISGNELGDIVLNGAEGTVKILGQTESVTDNRTGSPTLIRGDYVGSDVTDIKTTIGIAGAGLTDLGGMSTAMKAEVLAEQVKLLVTQMTESYAADGIDPTITQALMLIQQALTEFAFSGTSNTVKKLDGAATAAIMTLDDATSPTSSTRTT